MRFSDRANSIRPTGVRRMFDMAGDDTIQFGLGEPDFQPPQLAIEAFDKAMRDGRNKYTTTAGHPILGPKLHHSGTISCLSLMNPIYASQ